MSLSSRLVSVLVVAVGAFAGLDHAIQRFFVTRTFSRLERRESIELHKRVRREIAEEARRLAGRGLARWFHIVSGDDESSLSSSGLDLLFVCDAEGEVLWQRIEDPETRAPLHLHEFPRSRWSPGHPLVAAESAGERAAGVMNTGAGPMIVASQPFAGAGAGAGPAGRGRVVSGRFLTPALIEEWGELSGARMDVWSASDPPRGVLPEDLVTQVLASPSQVRPIEGELGLEVLGVVTDVQKSPGLLLRTSTDRELYETGLRSARYSFLSTLGVALLILVVLVACLRRMVIRPLSLVTLHAVEIGRSEETESRLDMSRDDEIGVLAREFDSMMDKLAASRAEVIRTSRLAGMSEVASGLLHNVGNSLTTVAVSAQRLERLAHEVPLADLAALNAVLAEHAEDLTGFLTRDPRGSRFAELLAGMERDFEERLSGLFSEAGDLRAGVSRIGELIRSQEDFVGARGVLEPTSLSEELDVALGLCAHSRTIELDLAVETEYGPTRKTWVDRNKLREILVNLIRNAEQSLESSCRSDKRLVLRTMQCDEGPLRLEVLDNGIGIAANNLTRIFRPGFTTREEGHGFGLHAAANSARELGGRLTAYSAGVGEGARFTLELPFRPAGERRESERRLADRRACA